MRIFLDISKKNWLKFFIGFLFCLLVRLIPFRPPNVEPILATQMPMSKHYGPYTGFLFGFFSIVFYDLLTQTLGPWSFFTAGAYGLLGFWAFYFFQNKKNNRWSYVYFAIIGTIFFDAATGLSVGPLFFGQSFMGALIGQIPFTLWHLLGNISFALVLSPAIYNFVAKNERQENFILVPRKI